MSERVTVEGTREQLAELGVAGCERPFLEMAPVPQRQVLARTLDRITERNEREVTGG